MLTDPIADMLTRIRNANRMKHKTVEIPASKVKIQIVRILQREGYIRSYRILRDHKQGVIRIKLKYGPEGEQVITNLQRVSKPGRRIYVRCREIPRVRAGLGIAILSTPKGIMTDEEARRRHVGGEVLCYVW
ncbi:MAG TPA: 30S ribosomal protein S8 [Armatimonadetes bacterium]|nr:30S ribosomal protein S8 [Armatimonadota bacterium]